MPTVVIFGGYTNFWVIRTVWSPVQSVGRYITSFLTLLIRIYGPAAGARIDIYRYSDTRTFHTALIQLGSLT